MVTASEDGLHKEEIAHSAAASEGEHHGRSRGTTLFLAVEYFPGPLCLELVLLNFAGQGCTTRAAP